MLRLKDLLAMGENQLEQANVPDYAHDARALMEFAFNLDRSQMFMKWADDIDDVWCDNYLDIVHRRALGEPLQYITGVQNFMGIDFKVNENVLIPRQDTERVVENARLIVESKTTKKTADPESPYIYETVAARKNWKILDLCWASETQNHIIFMQTGAQGIRRQAFDIHHPRGRGIQAALSR